MRAQREAQAEEADLVLLRGTVGLLGRGVLVSYLKPAAECPRPGEAVPGNAVKEERQARVGLDGPASWLQPLKEIAEAQVLSMSAGRKREAPEEEAGAEARVPRLWMTRGCSSYIAPSRLWSHS